MGWLFWGVLAAAPAARSTAARWLILLSFFDFRLSTFRFSKNPTSPAGGTIVIFPVFPHWGMSVAVYMTNQVSGGSW